MAARLIAAHLQPPPASCSASVDDGRTSLTLAVPLATSTSSPAPRRAFREAARVPVAPSGPELVAVIAVARRAGAGVGHGAMAWDARIEASLRAVHAYLVRRALGEKWAGPHGSGRYGCSLEQLAAGLAPIMGWDLPPKATPARRRFLRRHRESVRRWLDWLQLAGLVSHTPQCDGRGRWWRTVIELHAVPTVDRELLAAARRRLGGWSRAERRRRARGRRRDLSVLIRRACLTRAQRRERGQRHARAAKVALERSAVREAIVASMTHLRHPSGALTDVRGSLDDDAHPERPVKEVTRVAARPSESVQPLRRTNGSVEETRAGEGPGRGVNVVAEVVSTWRQAVAAWRHADEDEAEELSCGAIATHRVDDVLLAADDQARALTAVGMREASVATRRREVACWPPGRPLPAWRLCEAWAAARWGDRPVAMTGTSLARWSPSRWARRLQRATALYEAHRQVRPPGWPAGAAAALLALAVAEHAAWLRGPDESGAQSLAAHVGRLERVARMMRAADRVLGDPDCQRRARARVARRRDHAAHDQRASALPGGRDRWLEERGGPGWEEIARRAHRDQALADDHDAQGVDGTLLAFEAYVACFGDPAALLAERQDAQTTEHLHAQH